MHKIIIFLVLAGLGIWSIAQANPLDARVLQDHGSSIMLEFQLNDYTIEPIQINGNAYSKVLIQGQPPLIEKGMPELPVFVSSIIIPNDARMDYRIIDIEYKTIKIDPVVPSKGNLYRNIDPADIPYTFAKFYQTNTWWPEKTVELDRPFILRDYRGLSVRFNPFQFNPETNELKIAKRIIVEIYETGKGNVNILNKSQNVATREFVNIYKKFFINFSQARYDSITERAGRMIIICADAFMSNMESFKTWKRMKGIDTKLVPVSSIGNNETSIKNYIQTEYNAGDLVWVLLVGDGNEVVPATGNMGGANGADADPVYAYTSGGDYYPDIFISRFSSRSGVATNIDKQTSRSIEYEKSPQTGADWYHIGLGVASAQGSPADSTRMNWLRTDLLAYNYTEVNKSYDYWGTTAMIKGYIEAGTGIINYIGHGSTTSWVNGGGFSISDINNLDNPWLLPFVISVACVVGNFNGSDCFCEASMTAGTVSDPDGFIAHWGSSINQSWVPPCIGQEGANDVLVQDLKNTFGGICFNGACYMIEYYGSTNPEGIDMAQTWHIFGDASIQLRTDTPQSMTVNHASTFFLGNTTFDVGVPGVQSALVGIYVDTLLIGHGYTNASGNVTVTLNPAPSSPGTMYITVTAYNKIPYMTSIPITSTSGPYVVLGTQLIDDAAGGNNDGIVNPGETIDYGIYGNNVGTSTAYSVYGLLSETDPFVSLTTDSSWFGNIAVDDSSLSTPYYEFTVAANCPNGHVVNFSLDFHDVNDSVWTSNPTLTVYAPVLTYQDVSIIGGNGNGILDPGETADLVVMIENEGGATAANVTSTLWTSSSYITINDASGNFGTIDPGNQGNNAADPYNVTASAATPTGTVVNFEVEVVAGVYVDTLQFSVVVGKKHYYIWNPDPTPAPGADCHTMLGNLGYSGDYGTTLASDLTLYQAVLVFVGIYSNNYLIGASSAEAAALVDFLQNQGGRMYLEGGDVWYYDPLYQGSYDFGSLFGIDPTADGSGNVGPVVGQASTFTTGMGFAYGGENSYMDHISPAGTGFLIFYDTDNAYDCGVANDAGTYRTVGMSFELGGLTDASPPSTRSALLDSIMKFFGIMINPGVEEGGLASLPIKTMLGVMYPNPGTRVMSIRYQVAHSADVSLCVYDAAGRLVRTVIKGACEPGYYTSVWDARDDMGRKVPAGVYFVRFQTDDYQRTEKAVLLR